MCDAVVDTGFSRFLTLPSSIVTELGLAFRTVDSASFWPTAAK